jgi:hypothetical protein
MLGFNPAAKIIGTGKLSANHELIGQGNFAFF